MELQAIQNLVKRNNSKIVLMVLDGLGGLPAEENGKTELEAANTPNLDSLTADGICGLQQPVGPGITPGSGPGHLGLFGYDPLRYQVGRGVLSALGIDFNLQPSDIAARGNFCKINKNGEIIDRRAGRIPTAKNKELCKILRDIDLPGVKIFVEPVKEYRFLLVMRGNNLQDGIKDTDPQSTGEKPLEPRASSSEAQPTAELLKAFIDQARQKLAGQNSANMILLRGFSSYPAWPKVEQVYGLKAAAIAAYPMYRGVAKLVGMHVLENDGTVESEINTLISHWESYDFFFLHIKRVDSAGEDGDFDRKTQLIEEADALIPRIRDINPDVLLVTGDHSTPSIMKYHGWQPVPVVLWSKFCRKDLVENFGERDCLSGGLGIRIPAKELMPIMLANAGRLKKFGA